MVAPSIRQIGNMFVCYLASVLEKIDKKTVLKNRQKIASNNLLKNDNFGFIGHFHPSPSPFSVTLIEQLLGAVTKFCNASRFQMINVEFSWTILIDIFLKKS